MTLPPVSSTASVAATVCGAVLSQKDIQLIVLLTDTGKLARLVSKYRPETKILAASSNERIVSQMAVSRGIIGH